MRFCWEVEDGYVGRSRPQWTEISDEDLAACKTGGRREELIDECIKFDFDQEISWCRIPENDEE